MPHDPSALSASRVRPVLPCLFGGLALLLAAAPVLADELSDEEKALLGWSLSPDEIREWEAAGRPGREFLREAAKQVSEDLGQHGIDMNELNDELERSGKTKFGDPDADDDDDGPRLAPRRGPYTPTCIYGTDGTLLHAPEGAECASTERATETRVAANFAPPVADPSGRWAPIHADDEALYSVVMKQEISENGGPFRAEVRRGSTHVVVRGKPGGPYESKATLRLDSTAKQAEAVEHFSMFVAPRGNAYQIHAQRGNFLGVPQTIRFKPPVDYLPERIAKGVTWDAGAFEVEGIAFREQGSILGVQAAKTPAGTFDGCLVVRHTGSIRGETRAEPGISVQIPDGTIERTTWLARGVGPVMVKEQVSTRVVGPDGTEITTRVTIQSALRGMRRPAAAASASLR